MEIKEIVAEMIEIAKTELGDKWPKCARLAAVEFSRIAESVALIDEMSLAGELTKEEAKHHFKIQYNAVSAWIAAFGGMGIIEAESVLNKSLKALYKFIPTLPNWIVLREF
jgi:hypothetical protein